MSYAYTARAISTTDTGAIVPVLNGQAAQAGHPWKPDGSWRPPDEVVEQAILDASYCIDAPARLPLGGCYGQPMPGFDGVGCALQMEAFRP